MNFYMIFLYKDNVRNKNSFIYSNLNEISSLIQKNFLHHLVHEHKENSIRLNQ